MADVQHEDPGAQKRKISESPDPDSGAVKRLKVGDENGHDGGPGNHRGGRRESDDALGEDERHESNDGPPAERPSTSSSKGSKGDDATAARPLSADGPEKRRPSGQGRRDIRLEERKRGQRLFGGLLSALNQNKPNTHQVKRLEIERRQQHRAHEQRLEDDKRRAEKLAKLTSLRKIEQIKFDEQVYYRPWRLTERQEEIVREQIQEAEEIIEQEAREFKQQKERRLKDLGALDSPPESYDVGEHAPSRDANPRLPEPKGSHEKDPDEMGDDEMEQDKEDAVLY
ncbi:hypothetical protein GQ53DRAFT_765518 [Thozetella sp. PMI_491]|nr:hypothetical protein GQ53DRAFT_765518 [Thozetella sp. PMI_491]